MEMVWMVVKIGLDSGCLNAWHRDENLNFLDDLKENGKIEIFVPSSISREQAETQPPKWREFYLDRIDQFEESYEIGFLGSAYLGHFRLAGDDALPRLQTIAQICFQKPLESLDSSESIDAMALEASVASGLDFFLTKDKGHFIDYGRKEKLLALGIKVRESNEEFIEEIQKLLANTA
jgi:hypothetical protein